MNVIFPLRRILFLLLLPSLIAFGVKSWQGDEIMLESQLFGQLYGSFPHQIEEIDVHEATMLHQEGEVVFVDARSAQSFAEERIPNAVSLPVSKYVRRIQQFEDRYPKDTPIVVYCNSAYCSLGHRLAFRLVKQGYENVRIFAGGLEDWKEVHE